MASRSPVINVMVRAAQKAARDSSAISARSSICRSRARARATSFPTPICSAEQTLHEELMKARPDFGFLMEEGGIQRRQRPRSPLACRSAGWHHQLPPQHSAFFHLASGWSARARSSPAWSMTRSRKSCSGPRRASALSQRPAPAGLRPAQAGRVGGRHRAHAAQPRQGCRARSEFVAQFDRVVEATAGVRRLRLGRAGPRLCGGRPLRRVLGEPAGALGHRGGHLPGARGRAASSRRSMAAPTC